MKKKLQKSYNDKFICGVCGGIAEYLGVDSTVVRLVWAVVSCFAGAGVLAYIVAACLMPSSDVIG